MRVVLRAVTALIIGLMVGSAWGQAGPSAAELLQMLHAGGYVIVFRHRATHPDQADTDPLHDDNVAKQRQLNDKERADAKAVGEVFKTAGPQATLDVTEGELVVSPNENNRRARAFRAIVAAAPDAGTNTLVVTHKPNILDVFGKDFPLVARVQIGQWPAAKK